jgi:hypothetical protein
MSHSDANCAKPRTGFRSRPADPIAWVVFLLLHIPQMRDARVRAEVQLAQEISEENKFFCEKWGMRADTHEHIICTMDLNAIRAKVEQRIADDTNF